MKLKLVIPKTKKDLCQDIGISPQYLYEMETGRRPISPNTVVALSRLYGSDPTELNPKVYPLELFQQFYDNHRNKLNL